MRTGCGVPGDKPSEVKFMVNMYPSFYRRGEWGIKNTRSHLLVGMRPPSFWTPWLMNVQLYHFVGSDYRDRSVQFLSRVRLFATPWITACQASLSITNSQSLLKLMPIESVMPSSHLILYRPLLLLPPIPSSIRVFSNESTLCMRWPKYWSFSFSISPSTEHPGLISFRMD